MELKHFYKGFYTGIYYGGGYPCKPKIKLNCLSSEETEGSLYFHENYLQVADIFEAGLFDHNNIFEKSLFTACKELDENFRQKITAMRFQDIDRGINNFVELLDILNLFPNLDTLEINQNFSYNPEYSDVLMKDNFLEFLNKLKLKDSQSHFIQHLTNDELFNTMPEDSIYLIYQYDKRPKAIYPEIRGTKYLKPWVNGDDLRRVP